MDNKTIHQVDAFTDKVFKGNPAGVMILDAMPSEAFMQNIAAEMNLSETAFIAPNGSGFDIRYFTPTVEIPLCGHATLASAHIIYELGIKTADEHIHFKALKDNLTITKRDDGIVMTFPQYRLSKAQVPANFKALLGFQPIGFYKSNDNWVVAIAENQDAIEGCQPNFEALNINGLGHLMVTSEGKDSNVDFVVRCFVPQSGINEDPVTGSAHCALTPLWASRLGKTSMVSHQISKRGGVLQVALNDYSVAIKGKAVTVFEAKLKL